jgi:hypothetical protein
MKSRLMIIGSAPCAQEDLSVFDRMAVPVCHGIDPFDYMAVGLSSLDVVDRNFKYIANNHPVNIPKIRQIMKERHEAAGGNWQYQIIGPAPDPGVDIVEPYRPPTGSSAITGALAAIRMGYEKIILIGCPLTGKSPTGGNPYEEFRAGWEAKKDELTGKVKSMSGFTRELLGEPTGEWLTGVEPITVVTSWDGRPLYPKEYINILYRMVQRHTTIPHEFVLYIGGEATRPGACDGIDPAIRIVEIDAIAWWIMTRLWQEHPEGINTKSILCLDLDIVILGSLDAIMRFPSNHACSREYPTGHDAVGAEIRAMRSGNANIGVSLIRNGGGAKVWEEYLRAGAPNWDPLTTRNRGALPLAGQTIINDPNYGIEKDLFPSDWIASYKYQVLKRGIPNDCRIVHFHGLPKPHHVIDKEPWVKDNWR